MNDLQGTWNRIIEFVTKWSQTVKHDVDDSKAMVSFIRKCIKW